MSQIDLTISVISGSQPALTAACLDSLFASLDESLTYEVFLVDNASADNLADAFKGRYTHLSVIRNERRLGFGANHNQVIARGRGRYFFLLNDDTIVSRGACQKLVEFADAYQDYGFFGPRLINGDGTLQRSAYRFPTLSLRLAELCLVERLLPSCFDSYRYFQHDRLRTVDFVSGAALLVRASVIASVGKFDEDFFMYAEESDLMLRACAQGFGTLFVPDPEIMHVGAQSTVGLDAQRSVEFLRSHARLIRKHYGPLYLSAYRLVTFLKHIPRWLALSLRGANSLDTSNEWDAILWSLGLLNRPGLRDTLIR